MVMSHLHNHHNLTPTLCLHKTAQFPRTWSTTRITLKHFLALARRLCKGLALEAAEKQDQPNEHDDYDDDDMEEEGADGDGGNDDD